MEGQISDTPTKSEKTDIYANLFKKAEIHSTNTIFSLAALGLEVARWSRFNYRGAEVFGNTVNPHDVMFRIMQNMGDIGPGFVASAVGYLAIDTLCTPIEVAVNKKVPEQAKIAAAVLLGIGVIFAHEKGKFVSGSSDIEDNRDIVLGMLGPAAFAGTQYLVQGFIEKIDDRIIQIKSQKTNSIVVEV